MGCCDNQDIKKLNEDYYVCLNCLFSIPIIDKKSDDCCNNMNVSPNGICISCGTVHKIFTNKLDYKENDAYQTNALYKLKKVHNPYKYLKKNYPEIKNIRMYDFILESSQFIQDFYKLKRKPFGKYVPYLYNFYRENDKSIPIINKYKIDKKLILEKEILDKLNELSNNKNTSEIISPKYDKNSTFDNKYDYFNESKHNYFKKLRYCSFENCFKIANFKDNSTNIKIF